LVIGSGTLGGHEITRGGGSPNLASRGDPLSKVRGGGHREGAERSHAGGQKKSVSLEQSENGEMKKGKKNRQRESKGGRKLRESKEKVR